MERLLSISTRFSSTQVSQWLIRKSQLLNAALLPQDCFLCGTLAGKDLLCDACNTDLPRLTQMTCPICALPTPNTAICGTCLKRPPHFDATQASLRYQFPVDRLIQALKYHHHLAISGFFSNILQQTPPDLTQTDILMALPLAPQRLRSRGFNQALEIARPMVRQLGLPLTITGYDRKLDTVPQTSLPWKERQKNIQGAFECTLDLTGKRIIVVDDVMTTGATLNEFARTLKKNGATKVTNWIVARTIKD